MYCQSIRTVRDISRDDQARIATCNLRTPTDRLKDSILYIIVVIVMVVVVVVAVILLIIIIIIITIITVTFLIIIIIIATFSNDFLYMNSLMFQIIDFQKMQFSSQHVFKSLDIINKL